MEKPNNFKSFAAKTKRTKRDSQYRLRSPMPKKKTTLVLSNIKLSRNCKFQ